jgi:hypothetical protein
MTLADWGGIVGGIAAIVGAVVAIGQAVSARRARRDAEAASARASQQADKAALAFERMASAQEALATASRPSAWGAPQSLGGDVWSIRNSSGRAIVLLRLETSPPEAQPLLEVGSALPCKLPPGDILEFAARSRLGLNIKIFTLVWHFADEPGNAIHESKRTLR